MRIIVSKKVFIVNNNKYIYYIISNTKKRDIVVKYIHKGSRLDGLILHGGLNSYLMTR